MNRNAEILPTQESAISGYSLWNRNSGGGLRVCQRKENDLSAVLRDLWDGKTLRSLAKQEPAKATHPHGNLIGHITREELRSTLSKVDTLNGFANRILWYCAKRSKLLPDGGDLHAKDFTGLAGCTHDAIEFGKQSGRMSRSDDAGTLWHKVYGRLSQPRLGVFGAVTTRAEAHTLRLSMLFALLDCRDIIEVVHLKAALACWQNCEDSARWAFGASLGNQVADDLLAALREVKPDGLSSTDINNLFSRNVNARRIQEAIGLLERCGLVRSEKQKGWLRSTITHFVRYVRSYELNEKSPRIRSNSDLVRLFRTKLSEI